MRKPEKPDKGKDYPKYDDTLHIDSSATAKPNAPYNEMQKGDPKATEYTERYCKETEHHG